MSDNNKGLWYAALKERIYQLEDNQMSINKEITEIREYMSLMTDRVNHKIELEFCDNKYNQLIKLLNELKKEVK